MSILGGLDWRFTTIAMWVANGACLATLAVAKQGSAGLTLGGVWAALAVFMWVQVRGMIPWFKSRDERPRLVVE